MKKELSAEQKAVNRAHWLGRSDDDKARARARKRAAHEKKQLAKGLVVKKRGEYKLNSRAEMRNVAGALEVEETDPETGAKVTKSLKGKSGTLGGSLDQTDAKIRKGTKRLARGNADATMIIRPRTEKEAQAAALYDEFPSTLLTAGVLDPEAMKLAKTTTLNLRNEY